MTAVDVAERKTTLRAIFFYGFAAVLIVLLMMTFSGGPDFLNGLWGGILIGAAINLSPVARWLKPNSAVARLLDDESSREHRRMSTTAGFWAAVASALAMTIVTREIGTIAAYDALRVVTTAAMAAALISFATLELRASQ